MLVYKSLQQPSTMRMKFSGHNVATEIPISHGQGFAAGCRATIEHARTLPHESCDELGCLVLNNTQAISESSRSCNVSVSDLAGRREKRSGSQFDSFAEESLFCFRLAKPNCCHRHGLIVSTNITRRFESVGLRPAFDEPHWMSAADGQRLGRVAVDGRRPSVETGRESYQFAQNSIDEGRSRAFVGALDQFHALIDCSTGWYAAKPNELVNS